MPSEVIKDFRYDEESRTLFVTFQSGELYAYDGVEAETYAAMRRSVSRGRFFVKHVRDRYPYGRVDDPSKVEMRHAPSTASRSPSPASGGGR